MFVSCRVQNPVSVTMHQSKTQKFLVQQKNYHTQVQGMGPTLNRAIPLSVGHNPIHGKHNRSSTGSLCIQVHQSMLCKYNNSVSNKTWRNLKKYMIENKSNMK